MTKLRASLILVLVVLLTALALPASACSCVRGDPRDQLKVADGAIVGTLVSQRPDPENESRSIYTFDVEEEVKGEFEETLDVYSGTDGASCGFEMAPGQ